MSRTIVPTSLASPPPPLLDLPTSIIEELWTRRDDTPAAHAEAARSLAALLAELHGLRPFPVVAQRVLEVLEDPNFEIGTLQTLIEEDPALAARVLRVSNSAAFRTREPCGSIHDAIVRMGARAITEVVVSVAVMGTFADLKGAGRTIRDHCAAVGGLMRVLAERKGSGGGNGVFLAGLLHDVGKLLLLQTEDDDYLRLVEGTLTTADEIHHREFAAHGYDHAVLGGHVLRLWGVPEPLPRLVAWHHEPSRMWEDPGPAGRTLALLRLADQLEVHLRTGSSDAPAFLDGLAKTPEAQRAELTRAELAALWPKLTAAHTDALVLFR
jgi:HD-like signal output (HDOD) protein